MDIWKIIIGGKKNNEIYGLGSHNIAFNTSQFVSSTSGETIEEIVQRCVTVII